ncbi:unnamed protein product [Choristocarpus tenellus]
MEGHKKRDSSNRGVIQKTSRLLHGGRSPFAEMLLADEARFRSKQGLFQSMGLFSIFGKKLVEHLWLLWELVITGGPTMVVGPNVGASSAAILGMVSLASPVYFGGDFRPHFTAFDPDYRDIVGAHDRASSKQQMAWGTPVLEVQQPSMGTSGGNVASGFPSILLGVINPIFLRTLSRWPNAIVLPGAAGRSANADLASYKKLQRVLSEDHQGMARARAAHQGEPKGKSRDTNDTGEGQDEQQQEKQHRHQQQHSRSLGVQGPSLHSRGPTVRVQVVRTGASLEQVLQGDDRPEEPILITRQQPVMVPDGNVLSSLLDPSCPHNPATAAIATAAVAAASAAPPPPTQGDGRPDGDGSSAPSSDSKGALPGEGGGDDISVGKWGGGAETRREWKDSLRAINDVILRRHFVSLTRSFLEPFDLYFRPDFVVQAPSLGTMPSSLNTASWHIRSHSVSPPPVTAFGGLGLVGNLLVGGEGRGVSDPGWFGMEKRKMKKSMPLHEQMHDMALAGGGGGAHLPAAMPLSIYTDPETLLRRFVQEEFMVELALMGPPAAFQHVQWQILYQRFIESPSFRPWFTTQRIVCVEELRTMCREVCLKTGEAEVIRSCVPAGRRNAERGRLLQLLVKIKGSMDRERQRRHVDHELLRQMEIHRAAVDAALSEPCREQGRKGMKKGGMERKNRLLNGSVKL